jgi:hypothetical protein
VCRRSSNRFITVITIEQGVSREAGVKDIDSIDKSGSKRPLSVLLGFRYEVFEKFECLHSLNRTFHCCKGIVGGTIVVSSD